MAHITYIKISGLAGRRKDVEIEFNRDVNVIYGVNGVGKTTLLKIIHSALDNDPRIILGLPFASAEVGIFSVAAGREVVRKIENAPDQPELNLFSDAGTGKKSFEFQRHLVKVIQQGWKIKNAQGDEIEDSQFAHEYLPTTRLISVSDMASLRRAGEAASEEANINNMMEAQLQQQWVKYFSPLQAKAQEVQQRGIARILSTVLAPDSASEVVGELNSEVAYDLAKSFLASNLSSRMPGSKASFVSKYDSDKRLAAVVNQIAIIQGEVERVRRPKDQLQALLNNLFLNKEIDLSGGSIKVLFGEKSGRRQSLRLSQLSSGEKQALYILIHALRAEQNSLIIDEPELSMHIDWQRQLIGAIGELNGSAQMIMATHSPEIMAEIADKCIFEV